MVCGFLAVACSETLPEHKSHTALNASSLNEVPEVPAPAATPALTPAPAPPPVPVAIRVAVGNSTGYTDASGVRWQADDGSMFAGSHLAGTLSNVPPGVPDALLFSKFRFGAILPNYVPSPFTFRAQLPPGRYQVRLRFMEHHVDQAGERRFGVSINGSSLLQEYDILLEAGGMFRPVEEVFVVELPATSMEILFSPGSAECPVVQAIEILSIM